MKDLRSPRVFLSYAWHDRPFARQLARELEREGVDVWPDEKVGFGHPIRGEVEKALRRSDFLVFILSSKSAESPSVMFEFGAAAAQAKRIIPVLRTRRARAQIPLVSSTLRYVSAEGQDVPEVARRIRQEISHAGAAAAG